MLYLSVDKSGDKLIYTCKNCNFSTIADFSVTAECIVKKSVHADNNSYQKFMSRHIKHDPTLPRVKNIACTNESCSKPSDAENEVIYIKYDPKNLKYLYYCCHCETFWK
jgi:hypothetical protein